MQHREIVTNKLEKIEGATARLMSLLSRNGSVSEFHKTIVEIQEMVQDVKDYIQREPATKGEFK